MAIDDSSDRITATEAIRILGTYRTYFYNVLVKDGQVRQYKRPESHKRPYYRRSEIEALRDRLRAEGQLGK